MQKKTYKEFLNDYGWYDEFKREYTALLTESKLFKTISEAEEDEEDYERLYGLDDLDNSFGERRNKRLNRRKQEDDDYDGQGYEEEDEDDEIEPDYDDPEYAKTHQHDDEEDFEEEEDDEDPSKTSDEKGVEEVPVRSGKFDDPDLDDPVTSRDENGKLVYKDDEWEKKMIKIYQENPGSEKAKRAMENLMENRYAYLKKVVSDKYREYPKLKYKVGFQTPEDGAHTLMMRALKTAVEKFEEGKALYSTTDEEGNTVERKATFGNYLNHWIRGTIDDVMSPDRGSKSADDRYSSNTVSIDETMPGSGSDGDKAQTYADAIGDENSDFTHKSPLEHLTDEQKLQILEFINTLPQQEQIAFKMAIGLIPKLDENGNPTNRGYNTDEIIDVIKDIPGDSGRYATSQTALTKDNGIFKRAWDKVINFCKENNIIPQEANPKFDYIYLKGGKSNMGSDGKRHHS